MATRCSIKISHGMYSQREPQRALEPGNHTEVDAVALSDRSERLAGIAPLDCFAALVIAQLAFAAKLDAIGLGALATLAGALPDQLAFKLGNAG